MAWFEVQYRQALSNADITNKKAHKQVVTGNEILKSIIYPIPEQPLKDIKRNLKPLANNAKILFAFSNSPTHYTVYVEKREGGAIYRVDYTYKSYSLRRDQPLYEVMDFLEDASNVPEISNIYPADLTVLSVSVVAD